MSYLKNLMGGYPPDKIEELLKNLNLPTKISQLIDKDRIDIKLLVERAKSAKMNIDNNLGPVREEDIYAIYMEVL
jgi:alcohol dehydrogenase class IV